MVKARLLLTACIALLLLVVLLWLTGVNFELFSTTYLRDVSLLFAALGLVLIFLQFVFVSRIQFIEKGVGLDRMLRWHRFFGRAGLFFIMLHAVFIVFYRITYFGELFPTVFIYVGLFVLGGFIITASLASLYKHIRLAYETWRNIHLLNYILFPLVFFHVYYYSAVSGSAFFYLWVVLAVSYAAVIIYRLVRIYSIRNNPYSVIELKKEAKDIWSLVFKGKKIDFKPGQFMFIQLLRDGRLSSPHPFTISNSPTRDHLSITPKALGDFTMTIKDTNIGDKAFIDAPYGVFSFFNCKNEELIFIAGGIGITPFVSMLRYIYDQQLTKQVTLFWSNRDESSLCFREELEQVEKKLENFKMILIMSEQPDWEGEKGRLDCEMIRERLGNLEKKSFFICGPPQMTASIVDGLKDMQVSPADIHSEIFQL